MQWFGCLSPDEGVNRRVNPDIFQYPDNASRAGFTALV
ncbi:hypothetical Protein YC6258_04150 [Gynuella sunshinyii YC6258]|uniref:Uncharacterized protein n=1 Tax=Gynuella sunshinyii YC6258 TaxID=1445510 RepID=A0A0C5VPL6_9GAMM|nr:hypothetical Protein YC6258_04150 [Gynuella sunshinyii YC6258]